MKAYFEILNDEISTSIFTNLGIEHVEYVAAKLKNKLSYPKTVPFSFLIMVASKLTLLLGFSHG